MSERKEIFGRKMAKEIVTWGVIRRNGLHDGSIT